MVSMWSVTPLQAIMRELGGLLHTTPTPAIALSKLRMTGISGEVETGITTILFILLVVKLICNSLNVKCITFI